MSTRPNWSLILGGEGLLHEEERKRERRREEEEEEEEERYGFVTLCMETSFVWNSKDLYGIV